MKILIDFREALFDFARELGVDQADADSMWHVADLFDVLLRAALDSDKSYKEAVEGLIQGLEHETGESRSSCQSACDLTITQVLCKMDEVFATLRHVDLFKTSKDITRAFDGSMSTYMVDIKELPSSYI